MAYLVPPQIFDRMVALRRDLHRHPELSGEEERTGARIVAELEELGLLVRTDRENNGGTAAIKVTRPRSHAELGHKMMAYEEQSFKNCHSIYNGALAEELTVAARSTAMLENI